MDTKPINVQSLHSTTMHRQILKKPHHKLNLGREDPSKPVGSASLRTEKYGTTTSSAQAAPCLKQFAIEAKNQREATRQAKTQAIERPATTNMKMKANGQLGPANHHEARLALNQVYQFQCYSKEIQHLKKGKSVPNTSRMKLQEATEFTVQQSTKRQCQDRAKKAQISSGIVGSGSTRIKHH
jgi:hypothetical protein